MTYEDVTQIIEEMADAIGCEFAYYKFDDKPDVPYIVYRYGESDDFQADNSNYAKIREVFIEYYSDNKDFDAEQIIENILSEYDIPFERSEVWINEEKLYEISYELEII